MNNIQLNIIANAQFQQVYAEVSKLKEAMLSLQKVSVGGPFTPEVTAGIKASQRAFDDAVLSTRAFNIQSVAMTDNVSKFGKQLQSGQLHLSNYYKIWRDNAKGISKELDALATQQARVNRSIAIADPLRPGYAKVVTDINGIVTAQEKAIFYQQALNTALRDGAVKLIDFGKNTQWMGRQLTVGLTMPLAMFGASVANSFKQVDHELTRMQKVYGTGLIQPTQAALTQIRSQIVGLGNDLAKTLGVSVQETASMSADLAATGLQGVALVNATRQAIRLATLGELDHQQAMQATVSLQNVYKLSTQGLTDAVNFLNAVENQTSTSLQDLVDAIPRVGPIVQQLGGSFKDTAAMMVAMKEAGVPAAQGANAIKSALSSLINPTKSAQNAFKAYNIDIANIATETGGKPIMMLKALAEQMKNIDKLGQAQLIEKMFGKYQFARIQALLDNINKAGSQTATVFQLMGASTTDLAKLADNELKQQTESASGRFKRMTETVKADLLPMGEAFLNTFSTIGNAVDKIIKAVEKVGHLFAGASSVFKFLSGAGIGGLLVVGPLLMLVGLFSNLAGNVLKGLNYMRMFRQGMEEAGPSTNKFLAGIENLKNFYQNLDLGMVAARNQMELMPEAITTNAKAFEVLRKSIFDLTTQFEALISAQRMAMTSEAIGLISPTAKGTSGAKGWTQLKLPGFASGGRVPGTGNSDTVPAMLTPGESIVTKSATAKYGPIIDAMNRGVLPGFSGGGTVSGGLGSPQSAHIIRSSQLLKMPRIVSALQKLGFSESEVNSISSFAMNGFGLGTATTTSREVNAGMASFWKNADRLSQAKKFGLPDYLLGDVIPLTKNDASNAAKFYESQLPSVKSVTQKANVQAIINYLRQDDYIDRLVNAIAINNVRGSGSIKDLDAAIKAEKIKVKAVFDKSDSHQKVIESLVDEYIIDKNGNFKPEAVSRGYVILGDTAAEESAKMAGKTRDQIIAEGIIQKRLLSSPSKKADIPKDNKYGVEYTARQSGRFGKLAWSGIASTVEKLGLRFASGGRVPGSGNGDTIPAMLTPGESVVNKAATQKYGPIIDAMNAGTLPGFAPGVTNVLKTATSGLKKAAGTGLGKGLLAQIALGQVPNTIGGADVSGAKGIASAMLNTYMFTSWMGPEVSGPLTAVVGAVTTAINLVGDLKKRHKEHEQVVKETYSGSATAISMFTDATKKSNHELSVSINSLKSDNELKQVAENIKGLSSPQAIVGTLKGFASAQVMAGMDPKAVKDLVRGILTYTGQTKYLNVALKEVSNATKDLGTATETYLNKLKATTSGSDAYAQSFDKLTAGGKNYGNSLLNIVAALQSGQVNTSQLKQTLEGLNNSTQNSTAAFDILKLAAEKAGNADLSHLISQVESLGSKSVGLVGVFSQLSSLGVTLTGSDLDKLKGMTQTERINILSKKIQDASKAKANSLTTDQKTQQTLEQQITSLKNSLKPLEAQKKILEDNLKAQKNAYDIKKAEHDLTTKNADLTSQIKQAEISGNYVQATLLRQQQKYNAFDTANQNSFNRQQSFIDVIQSKMDAINSKISAINEKKNVITNPTSPKTSVIDPAAAMIIATAIANAIPAAVKGLGQGGNAASAIPLTMLSKTEAYKSGLQNYSTPEQFLGATSQTHSGAAANAMAYWAAKQGVQVGQYFSVTGRDGKKYTYYYKSPGNAVHMDSGVPVKKASGGLIYGPGSATSDSILARLSRGEYVVNAASVKQYGTSMLDAINSKTYGVNKFNPAISGTAGSAANGSVVYNINTTVNVDNADARAIADMASKETLKQLKVMQAKNNKANVVGY